VLGGVPHQQNLLLTAALVLYALQCLLASLLLLLCWAGCMDIIGMITAAHLCATASA
jgi:hypothetical protein